MKCRALCKGGPRISEVGFGAGPLRGLDWGPVNDETSVRAVHRALDAGVTHFDTADAYGNGHSERVLGRALEGRRARVVLATKGGWWYVDGAPFCDFSTIYLIRALQASLRCLRTDYIDLYYIHDPDTETIRRGGIFECLTRMKEAGTIRLAGVSIDTAEQGRLCIESGCVDVIQVYYSILDQRPDPVLFEAARDAGVGTVIKAPLARGLLSGKYRKDARFPSGDFREDWRMTGRLQRALDQVARVEALVGGRSPSLAHTALRFVLSHPDVSCVIPGAKTPEQAEANAAASAMGSLDEADVAALKTLYREMAGPIDAR
ncbi:MAG: aldo/keto reductase [Gemmatimonadota bacterium]|nr:aldo/keto reductase [Gemmatimonadota bacterium]